MRVLVLLVNPPLVSVRLLEGRVRLVLDHPHLVSPPPVLQLPLASPLLLPVHLVEAIIFSETSLHLEGLL